MGRQQDEKYGQPVKSIFQISERTSIFWDRYVKSNDVKNLHSKWRPGKNKPVKIYPPEFTPKLDVTLITSDKMFLKGESAVSNKKQRWNYGFGTVYIRSVLSVYLSF